MHQNQKQDSIKEMLSILKGDYNFPVKLWVWGKVIKEWAGLLIGGLIALIVFLLFIYSTSILSLKDKKENNLQQEVILPMKNIVTFMAICQRSINKRQKIFESLQGTMALYADRELSQKDLEQKVGTLSTISHACNLARGNVIHEFTGEIDPFEDPIVSKAFNKLVENPNDFFEEDRKLLDSQWESKQWAQLCTLCQNEVTKANHELSQLLKAQ